MQANCNYHQKERMVSGNNYKRVNHNYAAQKAYPSTQRNMAPRAVLMKTGLRPLNTVRPVNTAHPKTTIYSARPMSRFSKLAQSIEKSPYQTKTTLTSKNLYQKVNIAKGKLYIAKPKAVNTTRSNIACHLQKEYQGYVDSGCSRHMTENMSYLSDIKKFDGGYVAFGGGVISMDISKITRKQSKTGKHGYENQKTTKRSQRIKAKAKKSKNRSQIQSTWSTAVNHYKTKPTIFHFNPLSFTKVQE
ncbi:hypothetical protein Tco_0603687 [Tanacetum coccineum]